MLRPEIKIEGLDELNKRLNRIAKRLNSDVLEKGIRKSVVLLQGAIQRKLTNNVLGVGRGHLRRSIQTKVRVSAKNVVGTVGTKLKYARVHEFGATIRAKNKPYLRFKIHTSSRIAHTRGGYTRYTGIGTGKGKKAKRGYTWVMVKQVTIPARPYFYPTIEEKSKRVIGIFERLFEKHINK